MEEKTIKELHDEFSAEIQEREQKFLKKLNKDQKDFIKEIASAGTYSFSLSSKYAKEWKDGLNQGIYAKPSEYVEKKLAWLFDGYIYKRFKNALLYSLDENIKWPYSESYYRRSFRKNIYYMEKLFRILYEFHKELMIDYSIEEILSGNIPEKEKAYREKSYSWHLIGVHENVIAYELDKEKYRKNDSSEEKEDEKKDEKKRNGKAENDTKKESTGRLEEILTDIINGDSEQVLHRDMIRGIMKSENKRMHELAGRLLLAARLQEGLRQTICECMDCGSVSSFFYLLEIVKENNLIRFSSVKRAVGTWLGLMDTESGNLDRISDKSLELILECLSDEKKIEEYLKTEDSMKIYIALWATAFYDTQKAIEVIKRISKEGTHHQILTAGYFCANLDDWYFSHHLAKTIIADHRMEYDILAVYMNYFLSGWSGFGRYGKEEKEIRLEKYYDNKEQAEAYYEILKDIYQHIPKKKLEFSPCIFPWYSAVLEKSDIVSKWSVTGKLLEDPDKIDEVCQYLKEIDSTKRSQCLRFTLKEPKTVIQKRVVTAMLCDRETYTRKQAKEIVEKMEITEENYLQMEEMLKYKSADMRSILIGFLMKQDAVKRKDCIRRLLKNPKEEKRTAGLDMVMQLDKDENNREILTECIEAVREIENPTAKEKILIDTILEKGRSDRKNVLEEALFTKEDVYHPQIEKTEWIEKAVDLYMEYFPQSKLKEDCESFWGEKKNGDVDKLKGIFKTKEEDCETIKQVKEDCDKLHAYFTEHENDEYEGYGGEIYTFGAGNNFREVIGEFTFEIPGLALWKEWCEREQVDEKRLYRMYIYLMAIHSGSDSYQREMLPYIKRLFGNGFERKAEYKYNHRLKEIVDRLLKDHRKEKEEKLLAMAAAYWYLKCLPQEKVRLVTMSNLPSSYGRKQVAHFIAHPQLLELFAKVSCNYGMEFKEMFPLSAGMSEKTFLRNAPEEEEENAHYYSETMRIREQFWIKRPASNGYLGGTPGFFRTGVKDYIKAAFLKLIRKEEMYEYLFRKENMETTIEEVSMIASWVRAKGRHISKRGSYYSWNVRRNENVLFSYLNKTEIEGKEKIKSIEDLSKEEQEFLYFVDEIYEKLIRRLLRQELRRGDSETEYSKYVKSVARIYGMENFIAILTALGDETLERSTYYKSESKKGCLSHLLSVCVPEEEDTAEKLSKLVKSSGVKEKRLIEASLYSPEWMDIVGESLGWNGYRLACYYFMAHMNEKFDEVRAAIIAKYTPLTEEELNLGAFDIQWFQSAYELLGKKRFDMIYQAAKYISDGSKHSRARKYADAVLGKLDKKETEEKISDKRNKDLLMAYALIPLKGEQDLLKRYLFLQKFLKESRQFGAQRIASEKAAVEIAMSNLAMNAGFSDVMRLTLRMETKLMDDVRELFEEKEIEDVVLRLYVDENGKAEIECIKNGKKLKSTPAKLKKNEYVVRLKETKKKLTEQYRRTRQMFEQAMEDETEFTVSEILLLHQNPVAVTIVKDLLFVCENQIGFLRKEGLINYKNEIRKMESEKHIKVAHPYHIYKDGHWMEYQQYLFENKIRQNFKQIFRELYIKTEEERDMEYSRRYSGNQIQPKKTAACLKQRRWVADIEDGLQKIYYKENIIARIYALADWFSPADIEAPTLEWVEFSDRKTGKRIKISKIPDVIFSEVMRDVDLAVSVAHAGGVDPEASHSTVEMRAALLKFTLPLFKLKNVEIQKNHAIIKGHFGTYTINLGSGVIHKQGGAMIHVLPVHSQHRGKIFLPFTDDDPKTAEILTKVILFAEDKKIKDPIILEQIC